jgi:hypothetical protein
MKGQIMNDFRCQACNGTGLADDATAEKQQARVNAAAAVLAQNATRAAEEDRRWRMAAEAILGSVKVQGQPALDYIDLVMRVGERISA